MFTLFALCHQIQSHSRTRQIFFLKCTSLCNFPLTCLALFCSFATICKPVQRAYVPVHNRICKIIIMKNLSRVIKIWHAWTIAAFAYLISISLLIITRACVIRLTSLSISNAFLRSVQKERLQTGPAFKNAPTTSTSLGDTALLVCACVRRFIFLKMSGPAWKNVRCWALRKTSNAF